MTERQLIYKHASIPRGGIELDRIYNQTEVLKHYQLDEISVFFKDLTKKAVPEKIEKIEIKSKNGEE